MYDRVFRRWYNKPGILYFFFAISMLGAGIFIVGICRQGTNGFQQIPEPTLMMCLGAVDFALFFPFFLICVLTRYIIARLDRIESQLGRTKHTGSSPVLPT
jgi:ABC-type branched-subunit amino acid transport system permease subunit